jgi:hypothetical protein
LSELSFRCGYLLQPTSLLADRPNAGNSFAIHHLLMDIVSVIRIVPDFLPELFPVVRKLLFTLAFCKPF